MTGKPWQGRFKGKTSDILEKFSESISFDKELYPQDIRGSIAHARMLGEKGIIPRDDADLIIEGLENILADLEGGGQPWKLELEDVHMNIESILTERIGQAAGRLHTARSRNDQIALDLKLYIRDSSELICGSIAHLLKVILTRAEEQFGVLLPGYTHLQRAQPVLLSHHLLAYFEMLRRDHGRFSSFPEILDQSPLGSGALAGAGYPIDREMTASELGFGGVTRNSMDAVSDRDFAAQYLFNASLCQVHLSRLAEEIILWSTSEFGYVTLPDEFSTGSSMMPQKKNPDPAELVRGKTGRTIGNLTSLLVVLKGLPMTYNRDLQEDKEPVFDSTKTVLGSLEVMAGLVQGLVFEKKPMEAAAKDGLLAATDLADYLVERGVPFRKAHEITGNLVALCIEKGSSLAELSMEEMKQSCDSITADIFDILSADTSVARRDNPGGTAPDRVKRALEEAREWLEQISSG